MMSLLAEGKRRNRLLSVAQNPCYADPVLTEEVYPSWPI